MVQIIRRIVPTYVSDGKLYAKGKHRNAYIGASGKNKKKYIAVHQTGNTGRGANAEMHSKLQLNGNTRKAGWVYSVDDKQAIQSFEHDANVFHAGDFKGNREAIGVEMCVNSDGDYLKALKNTAEVVKHIMNVENIPLSNVVQHNHYSGKNCPSQLRASYKGHSWGDFKNMVQGSYVGNSNVSSKPTSPSKPSVSKPSPKPTQSGESVVDYMNSKGMNSSFNSRKQLATKYGIAGYIGSASQNIQLLNKLKAQSSVSAIVSKGANLKVDGHFGPLTIKALQRYFGTPVDGILSKPSLVIKKLQALVGARVDGYMGKETIKKMQRYFGTPVDGVLSKPSVVIKALQRGLNKGKL